MRLLKLWSHLWRLANVRAWDHTPAVSLHSHHLKGHSESELELHKIQIVTIGSTNLGCDVTWETEFCTVMSNICGFSVQNFVHVTFLAPGILRWLKPVQISQWSVNYGLGQQNVHDWTHVTANSCYRNTGLIYSGTFGIISS